ncbi:MOSC domain-containing protein [Arsenicibacter rosenii]|uniref:MOSC domain-containing protein n=1 Tax=Arsenicibacter rosenii TaxID=1750698 RepID=A0A1S2VD09_9BACT|nr:MOSC N-terminal beta barrel domain-containing protein [Arsenicibacter rosenii]OIN56631.1 MOSC domain-containing protein [Arsenicibacter rosenii]
MPTIQDIRIYPVKSLGGVSVTEAVVEEKGFRYDRRYMLVSPNGIFITQRSCHQMALVDVALTGNSIKVWHRHAPDNVFNLPPEPAETPSSASINVTIWDSHDVPATILSREADEWFSQLLGQPCHLVFMPETTRRLIDAKYARNEEAVSFADGYPYLIIGQSSLDDLNSRLADPVTMTRFRPNIIVSGTPAYDEDTWKRFQLGKVPFYGPKPCARCVLTTIDPNTGETGREPLRTLTQYRKWTNKILFGQNAIATQTGVLRVGDELTIHEKGEALV